MGSRRYASDTLGRRLYAGPSTNPSETAYTWAGDRLSALSGPGGAATYRYDADGRRLRSVVTSASVVTTTSWYYDGGGSLEGFFAQRSDGATYSVDYLRDERGVVFAGVYRSSTTTAPVPFLMVTTERGDVRELLTRTGQSFAFYSYDSFGRPIETSSTATLDVSGSVAAEIAAIQPLRYASYVYDTESGLYQLQARYYDPEAMQFISRDPIKADGERSAYLYCASDPITNTDPTGLIILTDMDGSGRVTKLDYLVRSAMHTKNPRLRKLRWSAADAESVRASNRYKARLKAKEQAARLAAMRALTAQYAAQARAAADEALMWAAGERGFENASKWVDGFNNYVVTPVAIADGLASGYAMLRGAIAGAGRKVGAELITEGAETLTSDIVEAGANCFVAGTGVLTTSGSVPIERLKPGDLVISRDARTGLQVERPVVRTFVHPVDGLVHVRVGAETITCTPNHPFRVGGRGWVEAGQLKPGDTLYLVDGGRAGVISVTRERLTSPVDVYNVEVADFHTYFVASAGVWVHNACAQPAGSSLARTISDWLGDDAVTYVKENGDWTTRSADNLRRIQVHSADPLPHVEPHLHVDWVDEISGQWMKERIPLD